MNTSLAHLTPQQRRELERAKRIIVQTVLPEKIILFGVFASPDGASSCMAHLPPVLAAYDLLVLTKGGGGASDYEWQDVIENRCRGDVRVTALVHDINYVNRRMREGQVFFAGLWREGILLFDAGRISLARPGVTNPAAVLSTAESDFGRWWRQALAFYRSAMFNLEGGEWRTALFLLHQAAEQVYQAILLAHMGYKPTTHNLDKLRRYTNRYSPDLAMVFPRQPGDEDRLFRLLLSGYVDARYKQSFEVSEADARLLAERVGRLLEIAERICRERIKFLVKEAGVSD